MGTLLARFFDLDRHQIDIFLIRLFTLAILFIFLCCEEEDQTLHREEWILTEYSVHSTSCCFSYLEGDDTEEMIESHPIFDSLLGFEDEGGVKTLLFLNGSSTFSIFKDGRPVMRGTMETNHQNLRLQYQEDTLRIKILSKTPDSLVLEASGYDCGPTKATMTFYSRQHIDIRLTDY